MAGVVLHYHPSHPPRHMVGPDPFGGAFWGSVLQISATAFGGGGGGGGMTSGFEESA